MELLFTIYILTIAALFGAIFGSFINCMAYRMVHGESVTKGRSHCPHCYHTLGVFDLMPIVSYIFLRGRCRYCKEKIKIRYVMTELLLALFFVCVTWQYGISVLTIRYMVLACLLLTLSCIDIETYMIPNKCILMGILWWAVTVPFMKGEIREQLKSGAVGAFAIAGFILLLVLLMDWILKKESMGGGDIKLYFMVGLYLGEAKGVLNLILSCFLGLLFALLWKKERFPFGPAISIATCITVLWGDYIVTWYLSLFGM